MGSLLRLLGGTGASHEEARRFGAGDDIAMRHAFLQTDLGDSSAPGIVFIRSGTPWIQGASYFPTLRSTQAMQETAPRPLHSDEDRKSKRCPWLGFAGRRPPEGRPEPSPRKRGAARYRTARVRVPVPSVCLLMNPSSTGPRPLRRFSLSIAA